MKIRHLAHPIDWRDAWLKMRHERMKSPKVTYDNNFSRESAQSFSKQIKLNDYEYGRKAIVLLSDILNPDFEVLEIGPGPGTLTIPLSPTVKSIIAIERSEKNIALLKANLESTNLQNVEIVQKDWKTVDDNEIKNKFDLVVCSHFLWQMENLEVLLKRMENASKRYCLLVQPCGRDSIVKEIFEKLSNQKYAGQFEPDADYFAYLILRQWSRLVSVGYFHYASERDIEEEIRYIAGFVGRFMEINRVIKDKIKDDLLRKTKKGVFRERNTAAVMWWQPEK